NRPTARTRARRGPRPTASSIAPVRLAYYTAVAIGVAVVALTSSGVLIDPFSPAAQLGVGAVAALAGVAVGIARSRRALGHVDIFPPLIFPLIYGAASFLAPAWAMLVN